ncbi:methyltransferase domain-containing protein [Leptolyngbya sp. 7M]|uniref:methyltransferase domain-containing protein n=1 Tax=Leptolyngbya sp. 7M TaxID=2812896 RepID=UPI001B8C17BB|nr:methyltransferase domain-containing protein [Leptolyngbya sp. 7M]QYO64489.1 methyltransferase domain-containing protein [Leptolyngbya sp. 7M]
MSDPQPTPALTAEFWEGRYQDGTDRWDLGQPAPPFVSLLQSLQAPAPGRIAVLGSGRGHDALLFAQHGFEVVGFDFAPSAIVAARAAAQERGLSAQFLQRDIFELDAEFANQFDYVLEHTCFCAILPEQRGNYVRLVQNLLRPVGELIGLFWTHDRVGGPPFGVSVTELYQQFQPEFEVVLLERATNSVEGRRNEEYLVRLRMKAQQS